MSNALVNRCVAYLKQQKVYVQRDWVNACIEWLTSEHQDENVGYEKLKDLVFEQWLLSDLREIGEPCLPTNIPKEGPGQVVGEYSCQVNYAINIAKSAYSQYQESCGQDYDESNDDDFNVPDNPKTNQNNIKKFSSTRMLLLELCDGSQTVEGVEYSSIQSLPDHIEPGTKVKLKGPIKCQDGMLLLTRDCISLIGGNSEQLQEDFSSVAIFTKLLPLSDDQKKQLDKKPSQSIDTGDGVAVEPPAAPQQHQQHQQQQQPQQRQQQPQQQQPQQRQQQPQQPQQQQRQRQQQQQQQPHQQQQQQLQRQQKQQPVQDTAMQNEFDDNEPFDDPIDDEMDDFLMEDNLDDLDLLQTSLSNHKRDNQNKPVTYHQTKIKSTKVTQVKVKAINNATDGYQIEMPEEKEIINLDDSALPGFDDEDDYDALINFEDELLHKIDDVIELSSSPKKQSFSSLSIVKTSLKSQSIFKIKAFVSTFLSKLELENGYELFVCIDDGKDTSSAVVSDQVMRSLIGYTSTELLDALDGVLPHSADIKIAAYDCQCTLAESAWTMDLTYSKTYKFPLIVQMIKLPYKDYLELKELSTLTSTKRF